ncbi:MAG: hypothetical protein ACLUQ0_05555 [Enterococcus italicus]|uniref:hypothetical protein n=1 Tax=Enterococcus italicus TaxID=246144 RepID=UPI0039962EC0
MGEKNEEREFPFHVVAIPDEYTILVSGGYEWNENIIITPYIDDDEKIAVGDKLKVLIPGNEIIDPFTKNSLGFYDYEKEVLEVTEIHQQFFECSKFVKDGKSISGALSPMLAGNTVKKKLNIKENELMDNSVHDLDEPISIGDPVVFLY